MNPPTYTEGLGELIRAHRVYLGLTPAAMATQLGMKQRSYERIESDRAACPPGLLDSVEALIDRFYAAVDQVSDAAGRVPGSDRVPVRVSDKPGMEWRRAVVGRAAIESRHITPVMEHAGG